jgi:sugar lactone lactonase YvrE
VATTKKASLELQSEAILGEGPVWDEKEKVLWWVDILSGILHKYYPEDQEDTLFDIGEHIGAFALRKKGGLLLAIRSGFCFFDPKTEEKEWVKDPETDILNNRFNDGKCDPSGRFWAGTMAYDLQKEAGSLYSIDPDLNIEKRLSGITISNGLAWNSEFDTFYFIDTPTGNIERFNFDLKSGNISDRSIVTHISEEAGYPDGMTIDTENKLWVALYGGGKVIRIDPADGKILFEIEVPVPKPTSCTFGGKELAELYITTCREHMTKEEIEEAPLSGSLFKAKLPFNGLPADRFSG